MSDFVNQTSVAQLMRCEQQHDFRRTLGPKPPKAAATFGSAFHDGIGWNYASKIVTGKDQPTKDVIEVAVLGLENRKDATEWDEPFAAQKDTLPGLVEVFHREICPTVTPVAVEEKIELAFRDRGWVYRGYVDLREQDETIVDNKTAGRSWPESRPQTEIQPLFYGLAEPDRPTRFRYDIAVKTKVPKVQRLTRVVSPEEKQGALILLSAAKERMDALEAGTAQPLPTGFGSPLCSQKWCGYWRECMARWHLPIPE